MKFVVHFSNLISTKTRPCTPLLFKWKSITLTLSFLSNGINEVRDRIRFLENVLLPRGIIMLTNWISNYKNNVPPVLVNNWVWKSVSLVTETVRSVKDRTSGFYFTDMWNKGKHIKIFVEEQAIHFPATSRRCNIFLVKGVIVYRSLNITVTEGLRVFCSMIWLYFFMPMKGHEVASCFHVHQQHGNL